MTVVADVAAKPLFWKEPEAATPLARFLPLIRAAVAAAPDRTDLRLQLASALFRTGAMAEIVDWGRPLADDDEADAEFLYYVGRAALVTQDNQLAFAALHRAAAKRFSRAFGYLAETLLRLERIDDALEAGLKGLQHSPSDSQSLLVVARTLFDRDDVERLWTLCLDLRARGAWGGWFPAVMATTAARLGLAAELRMLFDPPHWFSATQLPVPDDFNRNLAAELLALKSLAGSTPKVPTVGAKARTDRLRLATEPVAQRHAARLPATTTPAGAERRIERLETSGGPLAQRLLASIRQVVEAYVAERQAFADHPVMAHRPESVDLKSWGLVVHDNNFQDWHLHQIAWISGVYYVDVPAVVPRADEHPGAIEFGLFPFGQDSEILRSHTWRLTPEPGQLLLFPSYYAHRTWPTRVADPRICVAFDVRASDVSSAD